MRQTLSKISLAAVLIFGSHLSAQASVTDLGAITGTSTFSNVTLAGSFMDFMEFTVATVNAAGLATTSILFPSTYGALVETLNLYSGTFSAVADLPASPISVPFITTFAESGGARITTLASSANLSPGAYTLVIGGTSTNEAAYTGIIALTEVPRTLPPVPEPETYAMLLAGLGMLGFIARRRQKNI